MIKLILLFVIFSCSVVWAGQWESVEIFEVNAPVKKLSQDARALSNLAVSFDGRSIAYVRDWTSIWIADADGSNEQEVVVLTDSLNLLANPTWSPDGKYLVYSAGVGHSASGGKTSIWRVNLSEMSTDQLFAEYDFPGLWDVFASWSPDGSKIVVNTQDYDKAKLLVLDLRNGTITELTEKLKASSRPNWTSDSQRILVPGEEHDKGNLWLLSPYNDFKETVDTNQLQAASASFSADEKYILFEAMGIQDQVNSNYVIPVKGGKPVAIPGNAVENYSIKNISWDRHSRSVLANVENVPFWSGSSTIVAIIDTSGANFRILVDREEPLGIPFQRLAWSPDEEQITYTVTTKEDTSVYSVNLETLESTKITQGKNPTWSPYMDEIAFARKGNIWVRNVETGIESQVTLNLDNADQPQWSPMGDLICFGHGSPWGLWLVSSLGGEPTLLTQQGGSFNWSSDGTKGWGHNNRSNDYNGIWGDTWEYVIADAPNSGTTWGGSEGHFARVAPDGSYVYSFHGFQGEGIIIQEPSEQTGNTIFTDYNDLMPISTQASPSGTRIAFLLVKQWKNEIWKIDISSLLADSIVP